ncbi:uncharacterized protein LOC116262687 [Nymphaea colorata]|uniref:uncharacterized protein LOC116262687 n=1 Tax=Nymphaea colorata TaxID=210225 RepID=UPI00129EEFCF|nr:uncharacterized protein LOC116262687 [Nymphaea colorata]
MSVPSSSGDLPAVSTAKFGGGGLPRPYRYNEAKFSKVKIDPPEPVAGPFLSWARDAQLTMSSLRFDRRRSQGRIDGSIWRLREDEEDKEEEEEERRNQKKRLKMGTADSGESEESDGVDGSEEEEEESEKVLDSDESEYSSDSEDEEAEVDETEDTTDFDESEDGEEEEGGEQEIKGKPPAGCRRSKRLRKVAAYSEEE